MGMGILPSGKLIYKSGSDQLSFGYYYGYFGTGQVSHSVALHSMQPLIGYKMINPYYRTYFSMYSSNTRTISNGENSDINIPRQRTDAEYTTIILLTTSNIFSSITYAKTANLMYTGYFYSGNANALATVKCYPSYILITSLISGHEVKNVYI